MRATEKREKKKASYYSSRIEPIESIPLLAPALTVVAPGSPKPLPRSWPDEATLTASAETSRRRGDGELLLLDVLVLALARLPPAAPLPALSALALLLARELFLGETLPVCR
jgi:hypothetical protein